MSSQEVKTVVLFAEHCTRAGNPVPVSRDGEIDIDSPDYCVWTGTTAELIDQAIDLLDRVTGSSYHAKCGHSVLESVNHKIVYAIRSRDGLLVAGSDDDENTLYATNIDAAMQFDTRREATKDCGPEETVERFVVSL